MNMMYSKSYVLRKRISDGILTGKLSAEQTQDQEECLKKMLQMDEERLGKGGG